MHQRTAFILAVVLAADIALADEREAVVRIGGCSGVCVNADGHVLTAKHCGYPSHAEVRFPGGRSAAAARVYVAAESEGPVLYDCDGDGYPFAPVANTIAPEGEAVYSYGYPGWADGQMVRVEGRLSYGQRSRRQGLIVIADRYGDADLNGGDLAISPGHSGGPLFNQQGEVIGLASAGGGGGSLWISFAAVRRACDAVAAAVPDNAGREVPVLYVFTQAGCGPCEDFKHNQQAGCLGSLPVEYTHHNDRNMVERVERAIGGPLPPVTPLFWMERTGRVMRGYDGCEALKEFLRRVVTLPRTIFDAILGGRSGGRPSPGPQSDGPNQDPPELGAPESQPLGPPTQIEPLPQPEKFQRETDGAADSVEWGDVHFVILVAKLVDEIKGVPIPSLSVPSAVKHAIEKRKGQLRRQIAEATGGKATLDLVTQRLSPTRFAAVSHAAGIEVDKVHVIALVRKQDLGIKGIVAKQIEEVVAGFTSKAPVIDVVFERLHGEDYQAIVDALETSEPETPSEEGVPWYLGLIFAIYPPAREFFARFGSNQS